MRHLLITATLHAAHINTPREITTSFHTITNLAVEWRINGDDNFDAACEMKFRKQGEAARRCGVRPLD